VYNVSIVRQRLYDSLNEDVQKQLRNPNTDVFIGVLAGPGYGFAVLVLAIYWLGGVAVLLCWFAVFPIDRLEFRSLILF